MSELLNNILASAKEHFGLNPEATDAELHEAILSAKKEDKENIALEMAAQISELVKSDFDAKLESYTTDLENATNEIIAGQKKLIEELSAKVTALENKTPETSAAAVEDLRKEFGEKLNLIQVKISEKHIAGDGTIGLKEKAETPEKLPATQKFTFRV
jgi:hypothetical protein